LDKPVILLVVGTRPEAIKVAPLVQTLRADGRFDVVLLGSGQHDEPVRQALDAFGIIPDIMLQLQRTTGSLVELAALLMPALDIHLQHLRPAACVVHGDTITASASAFAAFLQQIPVVHLEAGLRTGDLASPFPEEGNRVLIDHLCALHLAPTDEAAGNLAREGIADDRVLVTGNTVIDAIQFVAGRDIPFGDPRLAEIEATGRRMVLVTVHRRESWGEPIRQVLQAVRRLVAQWEDIHVVLPTHPNPEVRKLVERELSETDRVLIRGPLPYADLARLLSRSALVLTDSGGIQEEAPSFGVPVLVLRETTERPEAIAAGLAQLVGTDPTRIYDEASALLARPANSLAARDQNPYGDGRAAPRSSEAIAWLLGMAPRPAPFRADPVHA
jgi:UDP-N-acetylglucosamine 2-epimerase (non-hydrolysing)